MVRVSLVVVSLALLVSLVLTKKSNPVTRSDSFEYTPFSRSASLTEETPPNTEPIYTEPINSAPEANAGGVELLYSEPLDSKNYTNENPPPLPPRNNPKASPSSEGSQSPLSGSGSGKGKGKDKPKDKPKDKSKTKGKWCFGKWGKKNRDILSKDPEI
ncbi:hypothetical protein NEDG_00732 [Nematocida displodere]|uniref:Uncharacterized protein n=1 Tax=Nematocida displodere TaxID=1805483 RepID=A0A177EF32_9MICR|nr:hypothetical protein NEDG_00732 [Nematocida displodere]